MSTQITTKIDLRKFQLKTSKCGNITGVVARAHKKGFTAVNDEQIFQQAKHQMTNYDELMAKFNNDEKTWCDFKEGRQVITHIYQQLADWAPDRFQEAVRTHFLRVLKEFRDDIYRADLYA